MCERKYQCKGLGGCNIVHSGCRPSRRPVAARQSCPNSPCTSLATLSLAPRRHSCPQKRAWTRRITSAAAKSTLPSEHTPCGNAEKSQHRLCTPHPLPAKPTARRNSTNLRWPLACLRGYGRCGSRTSASGGGATVLYTAPPPSPCFSSFRSPQREKAQFPVTQHHSSTASSYEYRPSHRMSQGNDPPPPPFLHNLTDGYILNTMGTRKRPAGQIRIAVTTSIIVLQKKKIVRHRQSLLWGALLRCPPPGGRAVNGVTGTVRHAKLKRGTPPTARAPRQVVSFTGRPSRHGRG